MLLVHGGRDHCRNWDWVAQTFRDEYHVVAPDLRGHGDSQWLIGANYSIIDYVYDIAQLIEQKRLYPVTIIGHSLGGSISLSYAGTYPERIKKIVAIEGLGPSPKMRTGLLSSSWPRRSARMQTARGSIRVAASRENSSGNMKRLRASVIRYSP